MLKSRINEARRQAREWLKSAVRAAVKDELALQRDLAADRARLDPHAGKLPAGVFIIPPQRIEAAGQAPMLTPDEALYTPCRAPRDDLFCTTMGKTVLVGLGGGSVDIEIEQHRYMPRGSIAVAWGPVHMHRILAGNWNVEHGGALFAVLPELMPGELVRVELAVWRR